MLIYKSVLAKWNSSRNWYHSKIKVADFFYRNQFPACLLLTAKFMRSQWNAMRQVQQIFTSVCKYVRAQYLTINIVVNNINICCKFLWLWQHKTRFSGFLVMRPNKLQFRSCFGFPMMNTTFNHLHEVWTPSFIEGVHHRYVDVPIVHIVCYAAFNYRSWHWCYAALNYRSTAP